MVIHTTDESHKGMIFINQSMGGLFADVIDHLRKLPGSHILITGTATKQWPDVQVIQCRALKKETSINRIITWCVFTLQTFFHLIRHAPGQHLLIVTNPPVTLWLGPLFKLWKKAKYSCLIYDIYPEAFEVAGIAKSDSLLSLFWRKLNAFSFSGAENIITISDYMARTLRSQLPANKDIKISVIENWADTELIVPIPKIKNPFLNELNLNKKFIISYFGSFGITHGVDSIIECANILKDNSDILFLLIGGGTDGKNIRKILQAQKPDNLIILPFQPLDKFKYVAAAPDICLVLQKAGAEEISMPSKVYTALASGTAIIAMTGKDSDLAALVNENRCGIIIPPQDVDAMAEGILYLIQDADRLEKFSSNARKTAVSLYAKNIKCPKYVELFQKEYARQQ